MVTRPSPVTLSLILTISSVLPNQGGLVPLSHLAKADDTLFKPSWVYGIELLVSSKPSNYRRRQSLPSILKKTESLKFLTLSSVTILKVPILCDLAMSEYQCDHIKLKGHSNSQLEALNYPQDPAPIFHTLTCVKIQPLVS